MSSVSYYNYGSVIADLNITAYTLLFQNHPDYALSISSLQAEREHLTCPLPDADVAGIGVVISFLIAGLMTTLASITAAILESRIDEDDGGLIFMPGFIHRWLARGMTDRKRERCKFWRDILERLILNLADQQLITGISLIVIGYIVRDKLPLSRNHVEF